MEHKAWPPWRSNTIKSDTIKSNTSISSDLAMTTNVAAWLPSKGADLEIGEAPVYTPGEDEILIKVGLRSRLNSPFGLLTKIDVERSRCGSIGGWNDPCHRISARTLSIHPGERRGWNGARRWIRCRGQGLQDRRSSGLTHSDLPDERHQMGRLAEISFGQGCLHFSRESRAAKTSDRAS